MGRYFPIVGQVAIAGLLASKNSASAGKNESAATMMMTAKVISEKVPVSVLSGVWLRIVWIAVTGNTSQGSLLYNVVVFLVLFATVLFANFAEAIAEARGKAQADSLRKTREETPAKRIDPDGQSHIVSSSDLRQGDLFECVAGDTVAADGEIVEGLDSIDESAITGESAPVIREAGGDKSSVTGGTKVLSDRILVKVTARPGESFLDKMIALVEGSSRQKTPNEIALTILLAGFTIVFVIVCATLKPFADYVGANITVAAFISLFVCLIPTTIGGLLSAIGIAGMDRALRANVITKSGKAVETAGDIDTLLLDKTGTITIGNRKATGFYPVDGFGAREFVRLCVLSSVSDPTPEGKSIVELGAEQGIKTDPLQLVGVHMVKFTAETKCSGVDMPDGRRIRKGASEAILRMCAEAGHECPAGIEATVRRISENGGTPLIVCEDKRIRGGGRIAGHHQDGYPRSFRASAQDGRENRDGDGRQPADGKIHCRTGRRRRLHRRSPPRG